MCGIVYAQSLDGTPVGSKVWEQYEKQKSRGTEGFGVFDGQFTTKAAKEKRIRRWFKRDDKATMLLFHHRFPTSTINVKRAAHPFNTGDHFGNVKYVLVHNGMITNSKELKPKHEELGIKYQSVLHDGKFNDSEALLWDVALTMEGKQEKMEAYGGIAFICIKLVDNKPEKMFFGRNWGRPLNLDRNDKGIMLSSEGPGEEIKENMLFTYNYELNRLTSKRFTIPQYKPYEKTWDQTRTHYVPQRYNRPTHRSSHAPWDDDYDFDFSEGYIDAEGNYERFSYQIPSVKPAKISELLNLTPNPQRVQAMKMRLLNANKGSFNQALIQAEAEFSAIDWITNPTRAEMREMAELLEVVDVLGQDPNWLNEDDIHPWWSGRVSNEERANNQLAMALNAAAGRV